MDDDNEEEEVQRPPRTPSTPRPSAKRMKPVLDTKSTYQKMQTASLFAAADADRADAYAEDNAADEIRRRDLIAQKALYASRERRREILLQEGRTYENVPLFELREIWAKEDMPVGLGVGAPGPFTKPEMDYPNDWEDIAIILQHLDIGRRTVRGELVHEDDIDNQDEDDLQYALPGDKTWLLVYLRRLARMPYPTIYRVTRDPWATRSRWLHLAGKKMFDLADNARQIVDRRVVLQDMARGQWGDVYRYLVRAQHEERQLLERRGARFNSRIVDSAYLARFYGVFTVDGAAVKDYAKTHPELLADFGAVLPSF